MKYGCVIFDETQPSDGWASIDGDKAFRIKGICDLRSDVLWWTSLSSNEFFINSMRSIANMRDAGFLRTSMSQLMDELGVSPRFVSPATAASTLSELFSRVMVMSQAAYGIKGFSSIKLADDIRNAILPKDKSISDSIDEASRIAHQSLVTCPKSGGRYKTKSVMFRRPRYMHTLDVMSTVLPGQQWEYIEKNRLPSAKDRINFIMNDGRVALVEAAVLSVSEDVANVISFGGGSAVQRRWMTHPELLLLSRYAKIEISSIFMFDPEEKAPQRVGPPVAHNEFAAVSTSLGLLAENYWIGLASPYKRMSVEIYSPRSAWLRAADRNYCFLAASIVNSANVQVGSYGAGGISIDVPSGALPDVIEIACEAGLLPPVSANDESIIQGELA